MDLKKFRGIDWYGKNLSRDYLLAFIPDAQVVEHLAINYMSVRLKCDQWPVIFLITEFFGSQGQSLIKERIFLVFQRQDHIDKDFATEWARIRVNGHKFLFAALTLMDTLQA